MQHIEENGHSFVIKTSEGHFVGYLNIRKGTGATPGKIQNFLNDKDDLIVERPSEMSDDPFQGYSDEVGGNTTTVDGNVNPPQRVEEAPPEEVEEVFDDEPF